MQSASLELFCFVFLFCVFYQQSRATPSAWLSGQYSNLWRQVSRIHNPVFLARCVALDKLLNLSGLVIPIL